jgi:CheY-like chemotaxis protein
MPPSPESIKQGTLMQTENSLARVFMVEDNTLDVLLTETIMKRNRINIDFTVFRDGEECINYFSDKKNIQNDSRPDLVLLDLNLPKVDGREVLKFIKDNPDLRSVPVVILSGSSAQNDIDNTRDMGALTYLVKPLDVNSLETITRLVDNLSLVEENAARYLIKTING